jgi:hypothetical protein
MDLDGAADLFYALLRAYIGELIRCAEPEAAPLRRWFRESRWVRFLVETGRVSAEDVRWCLAATRAKHTSRAKANISLWLAYKMSHSGDYDRAKRDALLNRPKPLDLRELESDELVGTYLDQAELCALVGKQVKFAREEEKILHAFDEETLESVGAGREG